MFQIAQKGIAVQPKIFYNKTHMTFFILWKPKEELSKNIQDTYLHTAKGQKKKKKAP